MLTFRFYNDLLATGAERALEMEDLSPLQDAFLAENVTASIRAEWLEPYSDEGEERVAAERMPTPRVSLLRSLFSVVRVHFITSGLLALIYTLVPFAGPVLLFYLIRHLKEDGDLWVGLAYGVGIAATSLVATLASNQAFRIGMRSAIQVHCGLLGLLYSKSLSVSNATRAQTSVGSLVNMIAVDGEQIFEFAIRAQDVGATVIQLTLGLALLVVFLGISALVGIAVTLAAIPLMAFISIKIKGKMSLKLKRGDVRLKITKDTIQGIRAIKAHAWEDAFYSKIQDHREQELEALEAFYVVQSGLVLVLAVLTPTIALSTFATFAGTDHSLDAETVFAALAIFKMISLPLVRLPLLAARCVSMLVSLRRIESFLLLPERTPLVRTQDTVVSLVCDPDAGQNGVFVETRSAPPSGPAVSIQDATLRWESEDPGEAEAEGSSKEVKAERGSSVVERNTLTGISLDIPQGSLVCVVGGVGTGKSSLLSGLLGELSLLSGSLSVRGRVVYVGQTPFISNASVRENVLFGLPFQQSRYDAAVDASALRPDLDVLPAGDETEIGERGVNLSGGQRTRVALARAAYRRGDVYLLDDCLAAVDAHTAKHLFTQCINGAFARGNATRILVTHQLSLLKHADMVVYMGSADRVGDGSTVIGVGTLSQLVESAPEFAEMMRDVHEGEEEGGGGGGGEAGVLSSTSLKGGTVSSLSLAPSDGGDGGGGGGGGGGGSGGGKEGGKKVDGKLMEDEDKAVGAVSGAVYKGFFFSAGKMRLVWVVVLYFVSISFVMGSNVWLAYWVEEDTDRAEEGGSDRRVGFFVGVYAAFVVAAAATTFGREVVFVKAMMRTALRIHAALLRNVLHFSSSFYDTTPVGRIINRFAKDVQVADTKLLIMIRFSLMISVSVFGLLLLASVLTYFTLPLVLVPVVYVQWRALKWYRHSARDLQRLSSISHSPVLAHFSESYAGATAIISANEVEGYTTSNCRIVDAHHQAYFFSKMAAWWLNTRISGMAAVCLLAVVVAVVFLRDLLSPAYAALAVQTLLGLASSLGLLIMLVAEMETAMTSVERIMHYSWMKDGVEDVDEVPEGAEGVPEKWPVQAVAPSASVPPAIEFRGVSMRYRENLPLALEEVSFALPRGQRIGVVGRTGAGKSSLIQALLRFVELESGSEILIDGVPCSQLSLRAIREQVFLIPQAPVLFEDSIRANVDPTGSADDAAIWEALDRTCLAERIRALNEGLDTRVAAGGGNFSVGERQLMCIARALIADARILLLDEASASIDAESDRAIQNMLRVHLAELGCSTLVIAHRIDTVIDSDLVLVMEGGRVGEVGSPSDLLGSGSSGGRGLFAGLVAEYGGRVDVVRVDDVEVCTGDSYGYEYVYDDQ